MPAADYDTCNNGNPYVASPNHPGNYDTTISANAGRKHKPPEGITTPSPMEQYVMVAVQVNSPNYTIHLANSIYDCSTQGQLSKFYHATLWRPCKTKLMKAIRHRYLQGWPGLTQASVWKHVQVEEATEKGHMKQIRQG
eukprot:12204046-Ditylum_brightwellii.AAC.1